LAKHPLQYRPDIDGLRAMAIILVMISHAFPNFLVNGYIGVDIFFVISGYLITSIILKEISQNKFSLIEFYIRRANRIFPCLIIVLAGCLIFGWLVLFQSEYKLVGRAVAAGAGFVANINNYSEGGYWDVSNNVKPLLHLWSLGVEEQFYIVWPVMLWLTLTNRMKSMAFVISIAICSFVWSVYVTKENQPSAYYLPFSRFWELMAGGMLAHAETFTRSKNISILDFIARNKIFGWCGKARSQLNVILANLFSALGLFLVISALVVQYPLNSFPGGYAALPVLGAALLIIAGPSALINSKLFSNRLAIYIGLISYPLYLWHWPIIVFNHIIHSGDVSKKSVFLSLAITFVLASATYHFVEKPIRLNAKWHSKKAMALTALVLLCGVSGYIVNVNDGFESRYKRYEVASTTQLETSVKKEKFAILGDSQSGMFADGMQLPVDKVKVFSTAGWPYLVGTRFLKVTNKVPKLTDDAISELLADKNVDVVVIANMYNLYTDFDEFNLGDKFYSAPAVPHETSKEAYYSGLRRTAQILSNAGKKIIYVKSIPFLGGVTSVSACSDYRLPVSRRKPKSCLVTRNEVEEFRNGYDESVQKVFHDIPRVSIFDPVPYICDEKYCHVSKDGVLMYRDTSHLSHEGAAIVGSEIIKAVNAVRAEKYL